MIKHPLVLLACILYAAFAAHAQTPSTAKTDASYDELVASIKAGNTSVDFKALRLAYTKTKGYSPYGADREGAAAAFDAIDQKKFKDAVKKADAM